MESTLWSNRFNLKSLLQDPKNYDFFQAVRLLQLTIQNKVSDKNTTFKHQYKIDSEIIRFHIPASLSFPQTTISSIIFNKNYYNVSVNFFGLIGACGVLPDHYTDLVISRNKVRDYALQQFLDIFQHRIITLYYKAWEKYKIPIFYEKEKFFKQDSLIEKILSSLYGQGTKYLTNRLSIRTEFLMYYTGILSRQIRSARDVEHVLKNYFNVPVKLKQFREQHLQIPINQLTRLSSSLDNQYNQLGKNAIVGQYIKSINDSIRLKIGPLNFKDFCSFLPKGASLKLLKQFTCYLTNQQFNFDIQLILKSNEVPPCKLSSTRPLRLGWQTWLTLKPLNKDVKDVILKNRE